MNNYFIKLVTWLVFVPVCKGKRNLIIIMRDPPVSGYVLVMKAYPVICAAVGSILTEQTVDKRLFKPISMEKDIEYTDHF